VKDSDRGKDYTRQITPDRIYREALERLDKASLKDDQMLSSFKQILRHGKHANQSTSNQQQNTSPSSSSKKQRDQPHQQPQQAAYYNNDMPTQGLTANNAGAYAAQTQQQPQHASSGRAPQVSPNFREEAERIVADPLLRDTWRLRTHPHAGNGSGAVGLVREEPDPWGLATPSFPRSYA